MAYRSLLTRLGWKKYLLILVPLFIVLFFINFALLRHKQAEASADAQQNACLNQALQNGATSSACAQSVGANSDGSPDDTRSAPINNSPVSGATAG